MLGQAQRALEANRAAALSRRLSAPGTCVESAVRRAPPRAERRDARGTGDDDQPLHQVRHQVDFVRRLWAQIHDEIGAAERERANARACARNFVAGMIAARGFERRDDTYSAGRYPALLLEAI